MGGILIAWGVFGIFNRSYFNPIWRFFIDIGPYYKEISILTIIVGLAVIVYTARKYKNK